MSKATKISFTINRGEMPEHTDEQFEEWAKYVTGCRHEMNNDNPLTDCDLAEYSLPSSFEVR